MQRSDSKTYNALGRGNVHGVADSLEDDGQ